MQGKPSGQQAAVVVELVGRLIVSHEQLAGCHVLLVLRWDLGKKAVVDDRAV